MHSPIITGSDAEGAGEMFRVTTLPLDKLPKTEDGQIDFTKDFLANQPTLQYPASWKLNWLPWPLSQVLYLWPYFQSWKL